MHPAGPEIAMSLEKNCKRYYLSLDGRYEAVRPTGGLSRTAFDAAEPFH